MALKGTQTVMALKGGTRGTTFQGDPLDPIALISHEKMYELTISHEKMYELTISYEKMYELTILLKFVY